MHHPRIAAIRFQDLVPKYFAPGNGSAIWRQEFTLDLLPPGGDGRACTIHQVFSPSGTGKSSLTAYLSGLRHDYSGQIFYQGLEPECPADRPIADLNADTWSWLRRHQVSVVFQDFRLISWLSPLANIYLRPGSRKDSALPQEQILGWAERLELDIKRQKPVASLSRGEQQRLAIIRALAQNYSLLILDEAFSHLDKRLHQQAADLVVERSSSLQAGIISLDLEFSDHLPDSSRLFLQGSAS